MDDLFAFMRYERKQVDIQFLNETKMIWLITKLSNCRQLLAHL